MNSHSSIAAAPYNRGVTRWPLLLLLALLASWPAHALAQQVISTGASPVVRVQLRAGSVHVRTWNKQQVQIASTLPFRARHVSEDVVAGALPPEITIFSTIVPTAGGPAVLPPEGFPLGPVLDNPHDGVVVFAGDGADVTLTIPASTALLWAIVNRGSIAIDGYRSGEFVALVRAGGIRLNDVGGDAFVEVGRGPISMRNCGFNRVRARTAVGNIVFQNCNVRQILTTSVNGSIAYDNGTFVPGIARFESENGNVAIGVAGGGALIDAHSAGGRIFSGFADGAAVTGTPTDAQAIVGPGGPVVTVTSGRGGIFLYSGALRAHGKLQGAWAPIGRILQQKPAHRGHV